MNEIPNLPADYVQVDGVNELAVRRFVGQYRGMEVLVVFMPDTASQLGIRSTTGVLMSWKGGLRISRNNSGSALYFETSDVLRIEVNEA